MSHDFNVESHQVGVPHDPLSFLQQATEMGHPKDLRRHVGQAVKDVLWKKLSSAPLRAGPKACRISEEIF